MSGARRGFLRRAGGPVLAGASAVALAGVAAAWVWSDRGGTAVTATRGRAYGVAVLDGTLQLNAQQCGSWYADGTDFQPDPISGRWRVEWYRSATGLVQPRAWAADRSEARDVVDDAGRQYGRVEWHVGLPLWAAAVAAALPGAAWVVARCRR